MTACAAGSGPRGPGDYCPGAQKCAGGSPESLLDWQAMDTSYRKSLVWDGIFDHSVVGP